MAKPSIFFRMEQMKRLYVVLNGVSYVNTGSQNTQINMNRAIRMTRINEDVYI